MIDKVLNNPAKIVIFVEYNYWDNNLMKQKKQILITNDDGVKSKGIGALIEMMKPYGNITVVAPFEAQSGMSAALTIGKPLRLTELKSESGLKIYACTGTPADCVKISMNQIFKERAPDLLVSGINHGSNASIASLYSGTLGATAEGTVYGIPSIGFSLNTHDPDPDFTGSLQYGKLIIDKFLENKINNGTYFNVNIPAISFDKIKGVKLCHQGKGQWIREFEERKDPYGFNYYWMTGEFFNLEPDNFMADHNAVFQDYISIVPHKIDTTDYTELKKLEQLLRF